MVVKAVMVRRVTSLWHCHALPHHFLGVISKSLASWRAHKIAYFAGQNLMEMSTFNNCLGHHPFKSCQPVPKLGWWQMSNLLYRDVCINWFVLSWDTANWNHYKPTCFLRGRIIFQDHTVPAPFTKITSQMIFPYQPSKCWQAAAELIKQASFPFRTPQFGPSSMKPTWHGFINPKLNEFPIRTSCGKLQNACTGYAIIYTYIYIFEYTNICPQTTWNMEKEIGNQVDFIPGEISPDMIRPEGSSSCSCSSWSNRSKSEETRIISGRTYQTIQNP